MTIKLINKVINIFVSIAKHEYLFITISNKLAFLVKSAHNVFVLNYLGRSNT